MFGIFPEKKAISVSGDRVVPAKIVIDSYIESLHLPIDYWSLDEYRKSWRKSISEGLRNRKKAALITSMRDVDHANFIFAWVLYFFDETVYVQNIIIFLNEYENFLVDKVNDFVRERVTHNEDELEISEWKTDLESVMMFYKSLSCTNAQ